MTAKRIDYKRIVVTLGCKHCLRSLEHDEDMILHNDATITCHECLDKEFDDEIEPWLDSDEEPN